MPSFSLRNPHFVIVGALIVALLGATALLRMPVDVFPNLKIPAVVVATFYPGMPPEQMEKDITTRFERFFTMANGVDHIVSRSLPGVSIIKVYFHSGVNVNAAASSVANLAMADLRHMPPGTLPPIVLKFDASSLPVTLVTVSGKGFSETQLRDQAQYNIRNQLATVAGASVPPPFGGKYRQIMVYVNRQALQSRGLTLMDVVKALNQANLIIPAGDAKIGTTDYFIYTNSMINKPADINNVPIKLGADGAPIFVRDVGYAEDASQIQQNIVRINGQRSVYVPILKQGDASIISVVDGVKAELPKVFGMPKGMHLHAFFDQSRYVRQAISSLNREAVSGTILAALMILIFLGSFRSTLAIILSIPLSILAGAFGLYIDGRTINIMTLGGFALAIGRLVDNSVVVLENINRHLAVGKSGYDAARDGAEEVALAVLASTLTTIVVFFPVMFLFGVIKYMFSALALAVALSMLASYVIAMTVIPIYCAYFLSPEEALEHARMEQGGEATLGGHRSRFNLFAYFNLIYERFAGAYEGWLEHALNHKLIVIGVVTVIFVGSMMLYPRLGTELFPQTDAGSFQIQIRAPRGSRIEVTNAMCAHLEKLIHQVIPRHDLDQIVANLGLAAGFSSIYSPNAASDSGFLMVSLKPDHKVPTAVYVRRLQRLVAREMPELQTFFSSGSIIDAVLNFGLSAPIDVQVGGPKYGPLYTVADEIRARIRKLPEVSEAFIPTETGYPTIDIKVDRVAAARMGLTQKAVVTNVITALTSNAMIAPSIWIDPKTGNDYFLTVQYPERSINSFETLRDIPVRSSAGKHGRPDALLLRNVATLIRENRPAEADHYNIERVVDVLVSPRTQDMGGTQAAIQRALANLHLPPGVQLTYRGSVSAMEASFSSFGFGLVMALALLYLVMVAQFRSFLDPFIIMFAVPMGLIGVVWILYLTGTTVNIESFMGTIMMVGIVVSNSILLVDFANQRMRQGEPLRPAIVRASRIRMRPILMTALATLAGLTPLALALERGSEASAPLARAAIGGLAVSTVFTLFLVPAVYELLYARRTNP